MNQRQQPPWLVNNMLFCYEGDKNTGNENKRKQRKHSNSKEAYIDGSKSIGRKIGFAAVFSDTTRKKALPEVFIHTAEMTTIKTALKEIKKRKDIRWVIYTLSLSSMLAIENNKENHPILN